MVGEKWQVLYTDEKKNYERDAAQAKRVYRDELAEYMKSSAYRQYQEYLADWHAKQSEAKAEKGMVAQPGLSTVFRAPS